MEILKLFTCSAFCAHTRIREFFPGMTVFVDPEFQNFLDSGFRLVKRGEIRGEIFLTNPRNNRDDIIINELGWRNVALSGPEICALLSYFGRDGFPILNIPKGQSEVNLILGYTTDVGNVPFVLYIEHKFEDGVVEEIHLRIRELNRWDKKSPLVLLIKQ